jgi:hypothetical protein
MSSISNFMVDGVEPILEDIDETFEDFTPLTVLSERTKVRPAYFILGFFLASVVMLGTGIFSHLFVALFGMVYPSYMSCKVPFLLGRESTQKIIKKIKNGLPIGLYSGSSLPLPKMQESYSSSCPFARTTYWEYYSTYFCSTPKQTELLLSTNTFYVSDSRKFKITYKNKRTSDPI